MAEARPRRRPSGPSLFVRLFALNAAILAVAGGLLLASPATVSQPVLLGEAAVLAAGLIAALLANAFFLRRALAPLEDLTALTHRVDLLRPGRRLAVKGDYREVTELADAFNTMLERLERERHESARRSFRAQEDERLRVARELHDEVGQALTALLLQHEALAQQEPVDRSMLAEMRESVREALDDVRRIAGDLRPIPLDDLGLVGALEHMSKRTANQAGIGLSLWVPRRLPPVTQDAETALYRVAQEALTNVLRHASATRVEVELATASDGTRVRLRVADDGGGLDGSREGVGIRGMRERAVLVGGELFLETGSEGGAEVVLNLPVDLPHEGGAE